MIRLHAVIRGDVQGVGYRYHTVREAQSLSLVGWVRNCPDGSVEVVAEGSPEATRQLLSWLERGPPAAEVTDVKVEWQTTAGRYAGFEVRF